MSLLYLRHPTALFFFFNDTATTEIYTLSLHDALPISHAGCFSMALAAGLTKAGHNPKRISTTANVSLEKVGEGFKITTIELNTEGEVPGIDEQTFLDAAESAKKNCPVSQALAGVDIKLNATFVTG